MPVKDPEKYKSPYAAFPNWVLFVLFISAGVSGIGGVILIAMYTIYGVEEIGELQLANAPGNVSIIRERDTKILHIKGDDWVSIAYGQGFASAQTRLW